MTNRADLLRRQGFACFQVHPGVGGGVVVCGPGRTALSIRLGVPVPLQGDVIEGGKIAIDNKSGGGFLHAARHRIGIVKKVIRRKHQGGDRVGRTEARITEINIAPTDQIIISIIFTQRYQSQQTAIVGIFM